MILHDPKMIGRKSIRFKNFVFSNIILVISVGDGIKYGGVNGLWVLVS
jgi:hypothetical protein